MHTNYVHGYDARETQRLSDQADTLAELLHHDTGYPAGSTVLEAGCGVGAQTVTLAPRSPRARITSVGVSAASGFADVAFAQADIFALPFAPASFDHVFLCFVLEHLADPVGALTALARVV